MNDDALPVPSRLVAPPTTAVDGTPAPAPAATPKAPRGVGKAFVVGIAVVASAVGATAGVIAGTRIAEKHTVTTVAAAPTPEPAQTVSAGLNVTAIAQKLKPSVVTIKTRTSEGTAAGTGIVLANGEILTNAHVVADAEKVVVYPAGSKTSRSAKVLGADAGHDLALIKVSDTSGLTPATLGDSSKLVVGAQVVAIGDALDLGKDPSVTQGVISALDRDVDKTLRGVIQTDASINPGNSGGPLINARGEVIGINSAVAANPNSGEVAQNIGFAIPINRAKSLLAELRAGGVEDNSSSNDGSGNGSGGSDPYGGQGGSGNPGGSGGQMSPGDLWNYLFGNQA